MNLGIAFQLVDDALDYGGRAAKLGKNVGDDFREGKITLPVVLSFRRGTRRSARSGAAPSRTASRARATSSTPIAIMRRTARSRTRSSAPATTAPSRATRWRCSRTAP